MRRALALTLATLLAASVGAAAVTHAASSGSGQTCGDLVESNCGVHAATPSGDFHGLIMVPGQPSILDTAAHSGTQPGCGDCTWTLIRACMYNTPGNPSDQDVCLGATGSPVCDKGQMLYRVYLTTDAETDRYVDAICLGGAGTQQVVPVGDIAAADVQRYLKDVTPPVLDLHLDPSNGIPAGMPAYFWVRPPADLGPVPFGGGQVTENITLKPERYDWRWGDGQSSGWIADAGAPYPDGTLTHTFDTARRYSGTLTAEWGGTYTITVAGQTFGPYDAIGTVTRTQPFATLVLAARSTLVSGG